MSEEIFERVKALEVNHESVAVKLAEIGDDIKGMIERAVCRDRKMDKIIEKQEEMAPSVAVIRDGLIFIKWGRWLLGAAFAALTWSAGALDWIATHLNLIPRK